MVGHYISPVPGVSWVLFSDDSSGPFAGNGNHIACVLNEVRKVFIDTFGEESLALHPILSVVATFDCPMTMRKHHLIFLSSQERYYCQHIYQFAHELCHFMVPGEVCKSYRWFEEMLCEMMSWFALLKIAERKTIAPIVELLPLYDTMEQYISDCQSQRTKIEPQSLPVFVSEKLSYLRNNCYDRKINATIGYGIFPLFQTYPELWRIVLFLHTLTDSLPLQDALDRLLWAADVVEPGRNQFKQRISEQSLIVL